MTPRKLTRPFVAALALAATLAAPGAAHAVDEGFGVIPLAVGGTVAAGGLAVLDLAMLGSSIANGHSAALPWELLGLGLGGAGIGLGSVLLAGDATATGAIGVGVGTVLVGTAVWSIALPNARPAVAVVPAVGAESRGFALVGRF